MNQRPDPRSIIKQAAITIHNHAGHFPSPEQAKQMAIQLNSASLSNPTPELMYSNLQSARSVLERLLSTRDPRINAPIVTSVISSINALIPQSSSGRFASAPNNASITQAAAVSQRPQNAQARPPSHPSNVALARSGSNADETVGGPPPQYQNNAPQRALQQLEQIKSQRPPSFASQSAVTPILRTEPKKAAESDDESWLDGLPLDSIRSIRATKNHQGAELTISKKTVNTPNNAVLQGLARDHAAEFEAMGFRLLKQVGKGGMGVVILAKDLSLNRDVAIKIITDPALDFDLEAKLGAKFKQNDPVVYVSKAGKLNIGFPFLVMEYLEDVSDLNQLEKETDAETRINYCLGMAESVACLHEKGVLHRDLKPANFLMKDGKVYASDFGLAVEFSELEELDVRNEDGSAAVQGTPLFMPPEQATGGSLTPASDVYSLGVSIYKVLTGSLPYPKNVTDEHMKMLVHLMRMKESPIKAHDPKLKALHIPAQLCELLSRAADPKPENRPDMVEFRDSWAEFVKTFGAEYKRNKKLSLALKIFGPLALLVGIGAIGAYPVIKKSQRIEGFEATYSQTLSNTDLLFKQNKWTDAIALLNTEVERVEKNTDLDEEERAVMIQKLRNHLKVAEEKFAALTRAREFIEEGKRLLDPVLRNGEADPNTPPDLEGAREKFSTALSISDEVSLEAKAGLEETDKRECRQAYSTGLYHYNKGEMEEVNRAYEDVDRLKLAGLSEQQQRAFREMNNILENWDATLEAIHRECVTVYQMKNFDAFKRTVDEWKNDALDGDRNAISKILELKVYAGNNTNDPDFDKKFLHLYDCILEIDDVVIGTIQNPRILLLLQGFYMENIATMKTRITNDLIITKNYDQYRTRFIRILDNGESLLLSISNDGQMTRLVSGGDVPSYIASTYADLFNSANSRNDQQTSLLPDEQKIILADLISEKYSHSPKIMRWVSTTLSVSEVRKGDRK